MAVYQIPLHEQPEFDDIGPLTSGDRLLLRLVAPFIHLWHLAAGPAQMRRSHREPVGYRARDASAAEWSTLPDIARSFFDEAERALSAWGFADPRHEIRPTPSGAVAYGSILFAPATQEIVLLTAGVAPRRFVTTAATFQTWWADGSRLVTTNSEDAALFESLWRKPKVDGLVLRDVEDFSRLYAAHRRRAGAKEGTRPLGNGWADPVDNPIELMRRAAADWEEQVVKSGLYYIENDVLRLTWKGAILLTWSHLEPFRSYLAWRGRRRAAGF